MNNDDTLPESSRDLAAENESRLALLRQQVLHLRSARGGRGPRRGGRGGDPVADLRSECLHLIDDLRPLARDPRYSQDFDQIVTELEDAIWQAGHSSEPAGRENGSSPPED